MKIEIKLHTFIAIMNELHKIKLEKIEKNIYKHRITSGAIYIKTTM